MRLMNQIRPMLRTLLITALLLVHLTSFSQDSTMLAQIKASEKSWGIGVGVNGLISNFNLSPENDILSNDIFSARDFLKRTVALRMGV